MHAADTEAAVIDAFLVGNDDAQALDFQEKRLLAGMCSQLRISLYYTTWILCCS